MIVSLTTGREKAGSALQSLTKVCAFLATLGLIALPPMAAEAAWSVTQFEVFAGAPYQRDDGVVEIVGYDWVETQDWFPDFNKAEIERAFNEAAAWYSKEGFPEPFLEPIVDSGNGPAYRIYVCTEAWWVSLKASEFAQEFMSLFTGPQPHLDRWSNCGRSLGPQGPDWAAYNGRCAVANGARPLMFINADGPAFKNGKLTAPGLNTIAHELMHAIQANTVQGKSPEPCKIGDWITEGQADAISMDMLDAIPAWKGVQQPSGDGWISKKYGVRGYHENIALDPKGYHVSSFWRFLSKLHGGYGYLLTKPKGSPGVFDFEIQEPGPNESRWQSEAVWLDSGLYAKFNKHLNELLGLFMNDISMHIPKLSWTSGNEYKDWPQWVEKEILKECENIVLSARKPNQIISKSIEPLAGDCAWLTVNVAQATAQVSLQAESADLGVFKDIWIGHAEGNAVLTDGSFAGISPYDPAAYIGIWPNITVRTGSQTLLTFTNAADNPKDTEPRIVLFQLAINSSTNNLRGPAPAGPGKAAPPALKPSYTYRSQTLQEKIAATTAMITTQKNLDKEVLSPHASLSTSVGMQPNKPPCQEPFKYTPCGPFTTVSMELMPGTWGNLGQSAGSGGTGAQVLSSLMGQALANPLDGMEVMEELKAKLESINASSVTMEMPFFDYGFVGSINNASISTTVDGIAMQAIGPPDAEGKTLLIGSVNITQYTPFRMQGTFTAPLAYFEEAPGPNQRPVYKQGPILTGTFNQVAPWLKDSRVTRIQLQSHGEIADDVGAALGVPPEIMRQLREQGSIPGGSGSGPGGGPASSGSSTGGSIGGGCECECADKGKVDDLCEFFCEEEFANCPD